MSEKTRPHWSIDLPEMLARLKRSHRILMASDFDGTLSPLVDHAEDAAIHPAAARAIAGLLELYPNVNLAFLSGRSVRDLTTRLGSLPDHVIRSGNHGLELRGGGLDWNHPVCSTVRPLLDSLAGILHGRTDGIPGVEMEAKGASLTVHFRRADESGVACLREILAQLEVPESIAVHHGKMIVEFRPHVSWNKGRAIRHIMEHLGIPDEAVIYLGDDVTDEDVFHELSSSAVTIHVGNDSQASAAQFNARDPVDAAEFLQSLSKLRGN